MRYIQAEKEVTTTHKDLGDISFPVEVPQATSLEEAQSMCGGADAMLEFLNSQFATNAKNVARAGARTYSLPDGVTITEELKVEHVEKIKDKCQTLAKNYSPAAEAARGPGVKTRAAKFDAVKALVESGEEFTREQLLQLLALK